MKIRKNNNQFEILTPTGFSNFVGITTVNKNSKLVKFNDGKCIIGSPDHRLKSTDNIKKISELIAGDVIKGVDHDIVIDDIQEYNTNDILYDVIGVEKDNLFLIDNNIISHNCGNFLSSGETLIPTDWLLEHTKESVSEPIMRTGPNDSIWIWQEPIPGHKYLLTGDPSRGDSNDFHAMHVIDTTTLEQAVEFRGKCTSIEFARIIYDYSKAYNNAGVSIENNGVGWAVIQELLRIGQVNMIYTHGQKVLIDPNKSRQQYSSGKLTPGFSMSSSTRPLCLEMLTKFIMDPDRPFPLRSLRLVSEFKTFAWVGGRYEAMDNNCHDDLIMALAQWFYVYETYIMSKERSKIRLQAMIAGMSSDQRTVTENTQNKIPTFANNNVHQPAQPQVSEHARKLYIEKYIRKIGSGKSQFEFDQSEFLK